MSWRPGARRAYQVLAWALVVGVAAQVFLAGLAVFSDPAAWAWHRGLVHLLEPLTWALALTAWLGKGPRRALYLPLAVFGLIWLQYALVHVPVGAVRALHPVNALAIFALALLTALPRREVGPCTPGSSEPEP